MAIPGRLARLILDIVNGAAVVKTTNVWSFSADTFVSPFGEITVDVAAPSSSPNVAPERLADLSAEGLLGGIVRHLKPF